MKNIWVLIAATLFFSGLSFASPAPTPAPVMKHYQYAVRVPATQQGCDSEAKNLVAAITSYHSNLQNVAGACSDQSSFQENGTTYSVDSLVVNYDAAAPVVPFQVNLKMGLYSTDSAQTVYATYSDCLADVAPQSANFTAATGLSVLAASCEPESTAIGFSMSIQGLGDSPVKLRQFQNAAYESAADAGWMSLIQALLQASGASITKQVSETFFYYAKDSVQVTSGTLVTTYSDQECEAQRDQANALLVTTGAKNITTACHSNSLMGETLDYIIDSSDFLDSNYGSGSLVYYSYTSCMNDLSRLQAQAVAHGDQSIYMFCARGETTAQYQIVNIRGN